ncbi:MAG TPA: alpha/beta fold hydrolase [Acetobacteraceae bacterium]|nr:alpha/beta fold hydrolase [Acetobacteraceae bacterium]
MTDRTTAPLDPAAIRLHRKGTGPALVLLHCLGVTHRLWDPLDPLADRFTLLAYDLPGHGETPLPAAPYGVEELADQLAAVLRREGIARAHVCGLSLGGLVAQRFASAYPELTDRLILADTTPRYTDEMRAMWVSRAAAARRDGVPSLVPGLLKIWFTAPFLEQGPPAVRFVRETLSACDGEGYALACEALGAADLRPLAARIAAPTLVLCGDAESAAFQDAARWMAEHIGAARLEWIAQAAHCSVREQPEQWRNLLAGFLAQAQGAQAQGA